MIDYKRTSSKNPDFNKLVELLNSDLAHRDGADHPLAQFNAIDETLHVVLAYKNDKPIACGAISEYDSTTIEIKRMYVHPEARGQGIAAHILTELESWAQEKGKDRTILFMGINQPEARRLYERNGYRPIEKYGRLKDIPDSLCFTKSIS
ncbi:GNAT family N-acetyltransferase [Membranicola marinus]|uniref:GNAT family N-acetyltransferase n=1 Tax=Membranihabitans marinus TaxID=1227546 RepID=A0A953LBJ0_9BACT|nr:GNAT family N-acetyltransferase [Membranihabitans marinus]MBY5958601.1 GNAT family N-acetyltransferase [Membranihabitans marinus]